MPHPAPYQSAFHDPRWKHAIETCFDVEVFRLEAGGASLPVFLTDSFFTGRSLHGLEGGINTDDPSIVATLMDELKRLMEKTGAAYARFDSTVKLDLPYTEYQVSLCRTDNSDVLLEGLSSRTRSRLKKTASAGLRTVTDPKYLRPFYQLLCARRHAQGTPIQSYRYFETLFETFGDDIALYALLHGDVFCGGMIVLKGKTKWWGIANGITLAAVNMNGAYRLYWDVITDACNAASCEIFDMGSNAQDSGSAIFKEKWQTHTLPLYRYHLQYGKKRLERATQLDIMRNKLTLRQKVWKRLPAWLANRLGPILRRKLPFA